MKNANLLNHQSNGVHLTIFWQIIYIPRTVFFSIFQQKLKWLHKLLQWSQFFYIHPCFGQRITIHPILCYSHPIFDFFIQKTRRNFHTFRCSELYEAWETTNNRSSRTPETRSSHSRSLEFDSVSIHEFSDPSLSPAFHDSKFQARTMQAPNNATSISYGLKHQVLRVIASQTQPI